MSLLKNPSPIALYVNSEVDGCMCSISMMAMRMAEPFRKLTNRAHNYVSIEIDKAFLFVTNSIWIGSFMVIFLKWRLDGICGWYI